HPFQHYDLALRLATTRIVIALSKKCQRVPESVAARIRVEAGLAGVDVNTQRFPRRNGGYETPDYESAENRVDISVETGVGSLRCPEPNR
ncbi:MAG: hypothetical protein U1B80_09360, partial [Anaerolineaceae bacterium]|nr:hypothetical protein [Anaerolineaceae bacterium]